LHSAGTQKFPGVVVSSFLEQVQIKITDLRCEGVGGNDFMHPVILFFSPFEPVVWIG
jgi:hypothetical protein